MKLSFTATALFLAVAATALPYNGAHISSAEKREAVPISQPAMAVRGVIVPYSNPAGEKLKRDAGLKRAAEELEHLQRRQVPVEQPSMATAGNIVPYANAGRKA